MAENETLINRKSMFGKNKYIILISEEEAGEVEQPNSDGGFNRIKVIVSQMIKSHQYKIDQICKTFLIFN